MRHRDLPAESDLRGPIRVKPQFHEQQVFLLNDTGLLNFRFERFIQTA